MGVLTQRPWTPVRINNFRAFCSTSHQFGFYYFVEPSLSCTVMDSRPRHSEWRSSSSAMIIFGTLHVSLSTLFLRELLPALASSDAFPLSLWATSSLFASCLFLSRISRRSLLPLCLRLLFLPQLFCAALSPASKRACFPSVCVSLSQAFCFGRITFLHAQLLFAQ